MIRPPPLTLKCTCTASSDFLSVLFCYANIRRINLDDNRFPLPTKTASPPKSKGFVGQLYKASWKNPIIAIAGLNGLRWAYAAVRYNSVYDAIVDDAEGAHNLAKVSITLSVIYVVAFFIELYGVISVSMQRLGFIRAYLYLTFLASLLVTSASVLNGVSYFVFAEDLMWECLSLATEGHGYEKSLFRSHPWPGGYLPIPSKMARKQCVYAWVSQSWSQVASVFIFGLIPAAIYYVLVYAYYQQTINPSHHANLLDTGRRLGSSVRTNYQYQRVQNNDSHRGGGAQGSTTSRIQNNVLTPRRQRRLQAQSNPRAVRGVGGASTSLSTNTTGRPMAASSLPGVKRTFTSRSLNRPNRPPPLMRSPSPLGLTPGPPTFNNHRSKVYAAFAAPVASSDYDKFV
ncbi:unnamed protein product [Cyclocybe aegerita]|uniref:Uncharacterized protein n=1 Tax=Cyclocybe aegerita TaxID=1973307 RepID=A0A8S0XIA7_CYCAE|nr:unnamed protein product [Cyclocybe aegerita]